MSANHSFERSACMGVAVQWHGWFSPASRGLPRWTSTLPPTFFLELTRHDGTMSQKSFLAKRGDGLRQGGKP